MNMTKKDVSIDDNSTIQIATRTWVLTNINKLIEERYGEISQIAQAVDFKNLKMVCDAYQDTATKVRDINEKVNNEFGNQFFINLPKMIEQIKFCDLSFLNTKWFDEFSSAQHGHDSSTIMVDGTPLDAILNEKAKKNHIHQEYITKQEASEKFISFNDVEQMDFTEDIEQWYASNKNIILADVKTMLNEENRCEVIMPNAMLTPNAREVTIEITPLTTKDSTIVCKWDKPVKLSFNVMGIEENNNLTTSFKISIPKNGNHPLLPQFNLVGEKKTSIFFNWDLHDPKPIIDAVVFDFYFNNNTWYVSKTAFPFTIKPC